MAAMRAAGSFRNPSEVISAIALRPKIRTRFRVLCRDADDLRAHVLLHVALDADVARPVVIRTLVDGRVVAEVRDTGGSFLVECDGEVVEACDRLGIAMVLTRRRHFRH